MKKKCHLRPLLARDANEHHRPATELELLFDLVSVIAIAAAAHGLRHEIVAGHVTAGIIKFGLAFFCVWWPWNLFTWFASSFDNDDASYRITTMVIMFGAMFVAASMPGFFHGEHYVFTFIGYVIMRIASSLLWLRAGRDNPDFKATAARYAIGQIAMQVVWGSIVFFVTPNTPLWFALFGVGCAGELVVPWFAERAKKTQWHRHHVIERFGLLNIIVLGEVLLGSTNALQNAFENGPIELAPVMLALSGMVIALGMWWLYFTEAEHLNTREFKRVFVWGYGHFFIFAAGAAVGAGVGVLVDLLGSSSAALAAHDSGHGLDVENVSAHLNYPGLAVSIPIGIYIAGLWFVRDRYLLNRPHHWGLLGFALVVALSGFLPAAPIPSAVILLVCLIVRLRNRRAYDGVSSPT